MKKYNRKGNARERYLWEYHCDRVFKSHLNMNPNLLGDIALENAYRSWNLKHVPSFKRHYVFRGVHYFVIGGDK